VVDETVIGVNEETSQSRYLKVWLLPFALACLLATLALLTNHQALGVYSSLFGLLSFEPQWVSYHSTQISNAGHILGFFSLAILCRFSTPLRLWQIALLCIALAASYAGSDPTNCLMLLSKT